MTTSAPVGIDPRDILLRKKCAELSGPKDHWVFIRPTTVPLIDRSIYSATDETVPLGMGYVQAVLSLLHGLLAHLSYDPPGMAGVCTMRSASHDHTLYCFSWSQDEEGLRMGGFTHAGQPTFHAAVIGLVHLLALYRCGEHQQSSEVVERWYALVTAMERSFPRLDAVHGWNRSELEQACRLPATRSAMLQACDALRIALTYELPALAPRSVKVFYENVVKFDEAEGRTVTVLASELLDPCFVPRPTTPSLAPSSMAVPFPAPTFPAASPVASAPSPSVPAAPSSPSAPEAAGEGDGRRPGSVDVTRADTVSAPPAAPGAHPTSPSTPIPARPAIRGPHFERIRMALARGEASAVMVEGPTGVGKSLQVIEAALDLGWGIEHLTLHPGWEEEMLYGSHVRIGGRPRFVPGPWTRFAQRVTAGEPVVFILDELARARETIRDLLIDLLNLYSRESLQAMNSPHVPIPVTIPEGESGPFYLVNSPITQERFALPTRRVRVVATMNQGESYDGNELTDGALIRRFPTWLYLKKYEPDVVARILGEHLDLSPSHPLIGQMQVVERQVQAIARKEECFRAQLSLPTLQAWGKTTLWFYRDPASKLRGDTRRAFTLGAMDTWVQQVLPYKGDELDADLENRLLGIVEGAVPRSLGGR